MVHLSAAWDGHRSAIEGVYVIRDGAGFRGSNCSQLLPLRLCNELFSRTASLLSKEGSLFSSESTRIDISHSFEDSSLPHFSASLDS